MALVLPDIIGESKEVLNMMARTEDADATTSSQPIDTNYATSKEILDTMARIVADRANELEIVRNSIRAMADANNIANSAVLAAEMLADNLQGEIRTSCVVDEGADTTVLSLPGDGGGSKILNMMAQIEANEAKALEIVRKSIREVTDAAEMANSAVVVAGMLRKRAERHPR